MKMKKVINIVFGETENLTLESRLFLSSLISGIVLCLLGSVVALFISTSFIALYIALTLTLFLLIIYYFVRFKRIVKPFILPLIIISFLGISAIWIFGGGINGSNIMLGFIVLILAIIITPHKNRIFVIIFYIVMLITMYLIQYFKPELIINFSSENKRWLDSLITAIYSSLFIYLIIRFFLKQYNNEKNRAEENEKKYRFIFENGGEGIGFVNPDEVFLFTNSAAEKIFGTETGGLTNKKLKEFLSEDQYLNILEQTKIRMDGKSSSYEFEITRHDGLKRNIFNTAVPQFDTRNNFIGTLGIFRDITEQKRDEEILREKEEKYRLLIENSHDIIYKLTTKGVLTFVSPTWTILLGHPVYYVVGKMFSQFVHQDNIEDWNTFLRNISENGSKQSGIEYRIQHADGTWYWYKTNAVPIMDEKGITVGLNCISMDITQQKEYENKLLQLNRDKDRFLSILSHDLISPFNTLLGFSEVLKENIHNFNIEKLEEISNNINSSAQNTFDLLEDILMWSRIQSGKIPFKPKIIDCSLVYKEALETLKPIADSKQILINYLPADGTCFFADIDMIKTVFRNLISNAIKFTNPGGVLNINAEESNSEITISVSDNGVGIDPDDLRKLFDITQIHTTSGTIKESGTGLGLLLCKEFIEKHEGRIWVESEPGKGSIFKFTLPKNADYAIK